MAWCADSPYAEDTLQLEGKGFGVFQAAKRWRRIGYAATSIRPHTTSPN